jgi:hypothetical protein
MKVRQIADQRTQEGKLTFPCVALSGITEKQNQGILEG